jgi:hypothetical protein
MLFSYAVYNLPNTHRHAKALFRTAHRGWPRTGHQRGTRSDVGVTLLLILHNRRRALRAQV